MQNESQDSEVKTASVSMDQSLSDKHQETSTDKKSELDSEDIQKDNDIHLIPENNLYIVMSALFASLFLVALDQTIVATSLPTIQRDLNGSARSYNWVASAYYLVSVTCIPLYSSISNLTGRRPLLFMAIAIFLLGSCLCGAAQSMTWLCIARGLQGAGGGGLIILAQVIVGDIATLEQRGTITGYFGAVWAVASFSGPIVGGVLADKATWRWSFFINAPVAVISFTTLYFSLHLNPRVNQTFSQAAATFDFVGLALLIAGTTLFLVGLSNSGVDGWSAASTLGPIVSGPILIIFFGVWECITNRKPIIPPRIFKIRTTALLLCTTLLHAAPAFGAIFYIPVYFQSVFGVSALMSGVHTLPYTLASSIIEIITGHGISYFKRYRPFLWFGWSVMVLGLGLMTSLDADSSKAKQIIYIMVAGIGAGSLLSTPVIGMMAAMPQSDMTATIAANTIVRVIGGNVGIAISGAIFNGQVRSRTLNIPGYTHENDAIEFSGISDVQPDSLRRELQESFAGSLQVVWIVLSALVGVGFLCSLGVKGYSLQRNFKMVPKKPNVSSEDVDVEKSAVTEPPRQLSSSGKR